MIVLQGNNSKFKRIKEANLLKKKNNLKFKRKIYLKNIPVINIASLFIIKCTYLNCQHQYLIRTLFEHQHHLFIVVLSHTANCEVHFQSNILSSNLI